MKILQILTDGGMGDLLCQLMAVNYNIRHNKKVKFQVWVPDNIFKFALHVLPANTDINPFSKAKEKFNGKLQGRTTQWFEHGHTPMRTHPVDYGFHMLCDKHIYDLSEKNYLQVRPKAIHTKQFNLPEKYICVAVTAREPVKAMRDDVVQGLTNYIFGKGYTPVFLGREESNTGFKDMKVTGVKSAYDPSQGIDLVNKTSLLETAGVIAGSKMYIGMDGGLTHLAGFTDTTIIAGYTLVDPTHVAPIRNNSQHYKFHAVEPDLNVPNRYFQTNNSFYAGDYRRFPGWELVRDNLTLDKFIAKIELRLGE